MTIAPAPIDCIQIVPSDPRWPAAFAVEHIGSTAVPGLDATPVIDAPVDDRTRTLIDDKRHTAK